jgi:CDP-paratose 2-epimerase
VFSFLNVRSIETMSFLKSLRFAVRRNLGRDADALDVRTQLGAWGAGATLGQGVELAGDLSARPFDFPWVELDAACAGREWDWQPAKTVEEICAEIARHAREHPEWLEVSRG